MADQSLPKWFESFWPETAGKAACGYWAELPFAFIFDDTPEGFAYWVDAQVDHSETALGRVAEMIAEYNTAIKAGLYSSGPGNEEGRTADI